MPACHLKVTAVKGKFKVPEHWQEDVKDMAGGKQRALHRHGNAVNMRPTVWLHEGRSLLGACIPVFRFKQFHTLLPNCIATQVFWYGQRHQRTGAANAEADRR